MDIITDSDLSEWINILELYEIPVILNKLTTNKFIFYYLNNNINITPSVNKINLLYNRDVTGFKRINNVLELVAYYKSICSSEYFIEANELDIDNLVKDIQSEIIIYYKFIDLNLPKTKTNKTVHFIFEPIKYTQIPDKWKQNIQSCEKFHPVVIHSMADLETKLEIYPEFKEVYQKLDLWICKLDFLRLLLIYDEGGVYSDLDICYYNQIPNFNTDLLLIKDTYSGQINNCFIYAEKKNQIIYEIMVEIKKRINRGSNLSSNLSSTLGSLEYVLETTGPKVITDVIKNHITIPNFDVIIRNDKVTIMPKFCTTKQPNMFHKYQIFCHEQDGSWLNDKEKTSYYY